jgi:hypothetical protein
MLKISQMMPERYLKIEILINKESFKFMRYAQQACMGNLLVTVFAALPIGTEPNP